MWPFKRVKNAKNTNEQSTIVNLGMKMGEVHLNASDKIKNERNAARIDQLNLKMAELRERNLEESERYKNLEIERNYRIAKIALDKLKGGAA